MTRSMTGFASREGRHGAWTWSWDLRSVNGRGRELRLRVPDWIDGLDAALRTALQPAVARGNVTLSLKVTRDDAEAGLALNAAGLDRALRLLAEIEEKAAEADLGLRQVSAADVAAMRGVLDTGPADEDTEALKAALLTDLPALISAFNEMRDAEGRALEALLLDHVARVETLVSEAKALEPERAAHLKSNLQDSLARVIDNATGADADRVAQELALIAVKTDVTEETDRLTAHVTAARDLLASKEPKGRKLDFLTQEFNREANTLCSKAQFTPLTQVGLELKAIIDQMREQVQNVE